MQLCIVDNYKNEYFTIQCIKVYKYTILKILFYFICTKVCYMATFFLCLRFGEASDCFLFEVLD